MSIEVDTISDDEEIHFVPEGEEDEHEESMHCKCGPEILYNSEYHRFVWYHHPFDNSDLLSRLNVT